MMYICPVCGFSHLKELAYDEGLGSLEICPCCDYQFGYDDDDQHITHGEWRQNWIADGMIWDKGRSDPPANWNPREQLMNIGIKL